MSDLYKAAARLRLRFPSNRGNLTVEDLFSLPLKSRDGCDLDTIGQQVRSELKSITEESLVEVAKPDPRKDALTVAFEIVKDIIATKQDEGKAEKAKAEKAELKRKILDAMARKKDEALSSASQEELQKQLDALGA